MGGEVRIFGFYDNKKTNKKKAQERVVLTSSSDLTCKRGSVGQSEGLSLPRPSVRFRLKPVTSNSHEFELHRPSNKGTKLLLKVIKAIIIIRIAKLVLTKALDAGKN